MARVDDELPEIEVIEGDVDAHTEVDAEVVSGPSRSRLPWVVGAGVAVVVLIAAALVVRDDPTSPDEQAQPDSTSTTVDPADQASPDLTPDESFSPPVRGEWQDFPSTLTSTEPSPFMASLDEDRVLILQTQVGDEHVVGEILDLRAGTAERIADSPLGRRAFPMVGWTGSELVVAGGANDPGIESAGAAYDPESDSWRQIADPPEFEAGRTTNQATEPAVWTGEELISWQSELAYKPTIDSWREISPPPLAPRYTGAVAATATGDVLVWGGCDATTDPTQCHDDGALYDPTTDEWTVIPDGPLVGSSGALAVATTWDDRVVIVIPSQRDPDVPTVAALDPSTLEWQQLAGLPEGVRRGARTVVWTGTHLVGLSVHLPDIQQPGFLLNPALHRSRYPELNRWRLIPAAGVDRQVRAALWTPHGLLVALRGESPALFTPAIGEPCAGEQDRAVASNPSPDGLPELGATTYDNVAAAVLMNAQDIADLHPGVVDITVGPGLGVAYDESDGEVEIHRGLDDYMVTVHVVSATACGGGPAHVPGPEGRPIPVRFVFDSA